MTVIKLFFKTTYCVSVILLMQFSLSANTGIYSQNVEPEIVNNLFETLKKVNWEQSLIKIDFKTLNTKQPSLKIIFPRDKRPMGIKLPKVVIDDVIVMLNDIPSEEGLLTYNDSFVSTNKPTFFLNHSPG